jgi:hypothetical protein
MSRELDELRARKAIGQKLEARSYTELSDS